ncbi:MAG TPA: catalase family protein, partial [Polyangiales bacterium]|nr:catalase family protein [Polyangiales bacterium]
PSSYTALPKFVRVLGSSYFFMPSITAIKLLALGQLSNQSCVARESIPPDEKLHIDRMLEAMRRKSLSDFPKGLMRRATHAKMHGCLEARFRVEPDVAQKLAPRLPQGAAARLGLFGAPREYSAWVRFSNERPDQPDARPDLRAVAIKLLDVQGVKLLDGEEDSTEHDFIMISLEAFVAKNAAEFAEMVEAIVDKRWRLVPFLLKHPSTLKQLLRVQLSGNATLLERSYFSAVPYLLGDVAVKYSLRPAHQPAATTAVLDDPNYLREDLTHQLARAPFVFDFLVQVQGDPKLMPIEDATVVWDQAQAPFVKVASVELLQQNFDTPERNTRGENLSFNPWRCLPTHRPLGGLNRARREIYKALARFRHDRNAV